MPKLNDYECKLCGFVFEAMTFGDELNPEGNDIIYCKRCGGYTKRLISVPGVNTYNQDAPWIRSVREVVDKDGGPHCQEFLKHPTRDNLNNWMKVEGVRHFEKGEPIKPTPTDTSKIEKEVWEKHRKRHRIEV